MANCKFSLVSTLLFIGIFARLFRANENCVQTEQSSQKFAANIYKELAKPGGEVLVSPASLQAVLGLLQLGASGPTAAELSQTLFLPSDQQELIRKLSAITKTLQRSSSLDVSLASAIYVRKDVRISERYRLASSNLGSAISTLQENYDDAVNEVNKWISGVTHGLLKNVLQSGDVNIDTAMLLVNALYFKGRWSDASFQVNDTKPAAFHRKRGSVLVNMMHTIGHFDIGRDYQLNATFLELGYVGDEFALTIVLPDEIDGLTHLVENIDHVLHSPPPLHDEQVDLHLPKFRSGAALHLKPILQNLGLKHVFGDAHLADLTTDGKPLAVSDVVHHTILDVSETGTEAAAASAVGIVDRIFSQPIPFNANHPFLFVLKHKPSCLTLFIGHYSGP